MADGITVNAEAYVNSLLALQRPRLDEAVALALADTAKSAKVQAAAQIARRTGLKSATVKEKIQYQHVSVGDYKVEIKSSRAPLGLQEFAGTSENRSGVRIRAWGKSQVLQNAFMIHGRVVRRRRNGRLRQLWGPTVWGTFKTPEVQALIADTMRERLQTTLARRMAAAIRRQ